MFNGKFRFLILLVVVLLFFIPTNVQANTKKISGIDRYATSTAIALDGWKQLDGSYYSYTAVLVLGDNFPDALSAVPLAKENNAPILQTKTNSIPKDTLDVMQKLKTSQIIIIGGTGVISSSVENQLISLGIKTIRLGGKDRYETNIIVANKLNNVSEIAIVTGEDFADALSISPIAGKKNMPIILVQHNMIPNNVKAYIKLHNIIKTYVIGVGSSLNQSLVSDIPNVEQINGKDEYHRNLAVIDKFKSEMDLTNIYISTGKNFSDGLSGSALAATNCNPLILVGENSLLQKKYLDDNSITNYNVTVIGGTVTAKATIASANVDYEEKKISDMTNIKFDDITKIVFYDGRGGINKTITVEYKEKINEFMGYLDALTIKKAKNTEPSAGWIHNAVFYINEKKVIDITFVDPLIINTKDHYNIIKGDLNTDRLDKFLKSIESSYSTTGYDTGK